MKLSVNAVIVGLTVLLVVGLIFVVIYGCMSFNVLTQEHFSSKTEEDNKNEDEDIATSELTNREKELFEDLKNNKLSTEQIGELVSEGVLTEKLVEKFLNELNITPDDTPSTAKREGENNVNNRITPTIKDEEEFTIEGFTAGGYAKF